ncbi:MAG TPA: ABC transporter ATP-binding protein [Vicinamibacteria bacterium]|nr:ABC transporter ATP-binding protein [Vicinamibacteria bacterium]
MSSVQLSEVGKSYGPVRAVEGVSFEAAEGKFLTLLGPSGCGKTTTLRMIAGLERNDSGSIRIGGRLMSSPEESVYVPSERRNIGMVFQSYAIWPHMSVFENVAYPLRIRKRAKDEIRRRVSETLELLSMDGLAERPATDLSGGQQQRVAIARALVFEPSILLMDEPLSNLDAQLRAEMRAQLRELQQRLGITTIYVTHDLEEAMVLADTIAVMHGGRLVQLGSPEEIYHRPASRSVAAFFGTPNLLAGRVAEVRRERERTMALVSGAGWEGFCLAPADVRPGEEVTAVVRPEAIQMARAPSPAHIAWHGTVREGSFRGNRSVLSVAVGDVLLHVDAPPNLQFAEGEEVALSVSPESVWLVR